MNQPNRVDVITLHPDRLIPVRNQSKRESGIVKWFNKGGNFGFVISDEDGLEIFFHRSQLGSIKPEVFHSDPCVTFIRSTKENGQTEAMDLLLPVNKPRDIFPLNESWLTGIIVRFNTKRGAGEVRPDGSSAVLFLSINVLRRGQGFVPREKLHGRVVRFRTVLEPSRIGKRGRMLPPRRIISKIIFI